VAEMEVQVRQILRHHIFGTGKGHLTKRCGRLLQVASNRWLSWNRLQEDCSQYHHDVPTSSRYFIAAVTHIVLKSRSNGCAARGYRTI